MADLGGLMGPGKTPEWYTPEKVWTRAQQVMGGIDLDPCSNSKTEPNVPASQHFTVADDGLARTWQGRVYMNPPYGRVIGQWVEHLVAQYEAGRVTQAVALLPARTDTKWMARLRAYPRCYIRGRLRFSGHDTGAPFPSVVVALGVELGRFVEVFGDLGDIYGLVSWPV